MQSGCVSEATSVSFPGSAIFDLIVRTVTITSFFDQLRECYRHAAQSSLQKRDSYRK